jgi:hypothetical protein
VVVWLLKGGVGREGDEDGHMGEVGDVERRLTGGRKSSFGVVDWSSAGVASIEQARYNQVQVWFSKS